MRLLDVLTRRRSELLDEAVAHVVGMLSTVSEMFRAASGHLLENEILELDLERLDAEIDAAEMAVRRLVLAHLIDYPHRDIALGLALNSIVQELERIGDLSKSLSEVAELADSQRIGSSVVPLRRIRDRVNTNFDIAARAFRDRAGQAALDVMTSHIEIKAQIQRYIGELARDDSIVANHGIVLALGARMISRVSSHLSNVASAVALPFEQIRHSPAGGDASARV